MQRNRRKGRGGEQQTANFWLLSRNQGEKNEKGKVAAGPKVLRRGRTSNILTLSRSVWRHLRRKITLLRGRSALGTGPANGSRLRGREMKDAEMHRFLMGGAKGGDQSKPSNFENRVRNSRKRKRWSLQQTGDRPRGGRPKWVGAPR